MRKRILLVAATALEIKPLNTFLEEQETVDTLITGIGGVATAYALTRALIRGKYDLVLQAGIAGSFPGLVITTDPALPTGSCIADLQLGKFDLGLPGQWQRLSALFDRLEQGIVAE